MSDHPSRHTTRPPQLTAECIEAENIAALDPHNVRAVLAECGIPDATNATLHQCFVIADVFATVGELRSFFARGKHALDRAARPVNYLAQVCLDEGAAIRDPEWKGSYLYRIAEADTADDPTADRARREDARADRELKAIAYATAPAPRTGYQPPRYAWTANTQSARERFVELVTWPHAMRSAELAELAHLAADPATADDGAEWSAALIEVSAEDRRTLARIETSQATARAIFAAMVTP